MSLPTGAATSAKQDTVIGHLDGVEGILTTIDADTGSILTAVQLIDDAIYAEDVAAQAADKGVSVLAVRRDTASTMVGADNDYTNLIVDGSGRLHVAVGNTVTVASHAVTNAGTFATQAEQSGTWTVDLGATDNAVLDNIDADLTTIIGHVDGVEGLLTTIDADTGSILTAVQLLDDIVLAEDAIHSTGDKGVMALVVRQDSHADLGADGDYVPLTVDADGGLRVTIVAGAGSGGTAAADDADFTAGTTSGTPAMGVYESSPTSVTDGDLGTVGITQTRALRTAVEGTVTVASHAVTNAGTFATQAAQSGTWTVDLGATDNAVLDNIDADLTTIIGHVDGIEGLLTTIDADTGGILTAVQLIDNAISGSEMQVDVVGALPAGTNAIGKLAANSGVDIGDVDVTSISAGTNNIGNVGLIGRTTGGLTIFRSIDIDETEEEIKGTAGQVFSISAFNTTDAPLYLKFYNATAATVSVGTTTPVLTFLVPGNGDSDGAGFVWNNDIGMAFGTAVTVACTTGVADNDTGAPGANACIVNVGYV